MSHRNALIFAATCGGWLLVGFLCLGIAALVIDSRWGIIPLFAWLLVTCLFAFYALARASGEKR